MSKIECFICAGSGNSRRHRKDSKNPWPCAKCKGSGTISINKETRYLWRGQCNECKCLENVTTTAYICPPTDKCPRCVGGSIEFFILDIL